MLDADDRLLRSRPGRGSAQHHFFSLGGCERVVDDLPKAHAGKQVLEAVLKPLTGIGAGRRRRLRGKPRGQVAVAVKPDHILHDVGQAFLYVEAVPRQAEGESTRIFTRHLEFKRRQDRTNPLGRNVTTSQPPRGGPIVSDLARILRHRMAVGHLRHGGRTAFEEQTGRAPQAMGGQNGRHATGVPGAGLAEEVEDPRGATDRHGVELGRLEEDPPGGSIHLGIGTPHDSRQRDRPDGIGNDQHVGRQGAVLTIERLERFARPGETNGDLHGLATRARLEFVQVEGVQGLALLEHDKIGDVNRGADRPHSR